MAASAEKPVARGLHIGFGASPPATSIGSGARGGAGYESDGEPGPRPIYIDDYYGGFLLDPDGNGIEAVHFEGSLTGAIDHLWIRVADVQASKRFYETIAPHARIALGTDTPERLVSTDPRLLLGALSDHVTENLHMAFPASEIRPSTTSTEPRSRPATATTASRASGRSTTPATTQPSSSTAIETDSTDSKCFS